MGILRFLLACAALTSACGGSGSAPVGAQDAGRDTSATNTCATGLGAGIDCSHYCATFLTTCAMLTPNVYADQAACRAACETLSQDAICCRGYHADLAAMGNADVHCSHAAGTTVCP